MEKDGNDKDGYIITMADNINALCECKEVYAYSKNILNDTIKQADELGIKYEVEEVIDYKTGKIDYFIIRSKAKKAIKKKYLLKNN